MWAFRTRVRNILRALGVKTLGDLERHTQASLLGIHGIGRTTMRSLNAQMFDRDLGLYGSVRDD